MMFERTIYAWAAVACVGTVYSSQITFDPSVARLAWTTLDGLPQNSVASLCEDRDGYLWVGTFGGLARFDGQRFDVRDVGNRPDLPGNRIRELALGAEGVLWVHVHGVGLFRYEEDRFTRIDTPAEPRGIATDGRGTLWSTSLAGMGRVVGDRFELLREEPCKAIVATSDGAVWFSTLGGELVRLEDGEEVRFGRPAGLPGEVAASLLEDPTGALWVGSSTGAWRSTSPARDAFEQVSAVRGPVLSLAAEAQGTVWISSREELYRWRPESGRAVHVGPGAYDSLIVDRRGYLWAGGTKNTGLHRLLPSPLYDATAAAGLDTRDTWTITEGVDGSVIVLQTQSMVELGERGLTRRSFDHNTRCALVDRRGVLWVGQPERVRAITRDGETVYGASAGLSGMAYALYEGRDGSLWVGTNDGLFRRDGERFLRVHEGELARVRSLLEDESGVLWAGTMDGLARIEGESLTWLTAREGLSAGPVRALHLDEDGVLWAGTYGGGLSRVDGDSITRFTRDSGLADNFLACLLEDDDGRFWINSNSGPFVVRRADLDRFARGELDRLACTSFSREEGAREANGGNQPSGWRAPDGRMWFPTIDGVTIADPSELPLDEAPPVMRLESFRVDENRALEARFTGLGFSSPKRLQVQYRLVGHDPDWKDGSEREVRYSYIRPGDYEFQLRGRNGFGPWSPVLRRELEIEPRFHETAAFVLVVAVAVGMIAFGLSIGAIRRHRARSEELERLVQQRERAERLLSRSQAELSRLTRDLLTNQETERRLLSRELHDDVTQRLAALAMQAELAEARLSSGRQNTQDQLRDIAEKAQQLAGDVQQLSRRLHPVGLRTLGLTEATRQECEAFTRRVGIAVELVEEVVSDEVSEEVAVAAFRILQESLHNIEKHAEAGTVKVSLETAAGNLVVSVTDTGCGFEPDTGTEVGLGLITMRERAASIGGELSIVSHAGEGTRVQLRAPEQRN